MTSRQEPRYELRYELIVIGAGPAGAAAALEADARGLKTLLLDEVLEAGGQVYRAPLAGLSQLPASREAQAGNALRAALAASTVSSAFGHRVWAVEPGFKVFSLGPDGPLEAEAEALILATGALERHVPIPGWTLPGVTGLAAATVLLKSQAMLPGRRVVVAGSGPLLPLVAASILKSGGEVAAVVDATPRAGWLGQMPAFMTRPALLARGAGWIGQLLAHRVPLLSGHALVRIEGTDGVEGVHIAAVDAAGAPVRQAAARRIECDAVCYGFGLQPATELTRLLGAAHHYVPRLGGWTVKTDADQRTSLARLYAAGDGAGVLGVAAAPGRGRLAALAALHDLGRLDEAAWQRAARPLRRRLARAAAFGQGMTALAAPGLASHERITAGTTVCRCEGLNRETLDAAIAQGAVSLNDLKAATRCGMGPCGGRVCGDTAAALIAAATGQAREMIHEATARPPLRPLPLDQLVGDFNYADLPIPAPAPL